MTGKKSRSIYVNKIYFFSGIIAYLVIINVLLWCYYKKILTLAGLIITFEIISFVGVIILIACCRCRNEHLPDENNEHIDSLNGTKGMLFQLINHLPIAVLAVNNAGEMMFSNPQANKLLKCPDDQIINGCSTGKNSLMKLLQHTLRKGKAITDHNYQLQTAPNEYKQLMVNTKTLKDIDGNCLGAVLIAYDVTEHKQIEEQMQHAEKLSMITELATGISHEIKNPLTTARGLMQILQNYFDEEDIAQKHIKVAISEMDRINLIINELELLSQSSNSGNLSFSQLENVLNDALLLLDGKAVCNNIVIEKKFQSNLPLAVIDEAQMKQVFLNLGINALNAMPNGGKLTITARFNNTSQEFEICFRDNGIGISKDQLNKIFLPFYTTEENHTGLGLTLCYQMVKKHGGRIHVQSVKNKGSAFTVYLPAASKLSTVS